MTEKSKAPGVRYEVIMQEDPETGDLILPIPPPLLQEMGWKEGDNVQVGFDPQGRLYLKKA
jgi:hypothetical protein